MENENSSPKPLYFSRIQMRIQRKYEEMQRKLERSKSFDSLHSVLDFNKADEVYTTVKNEHNNSKMEDSSQLLQHNESVVSFEEIKVQDAFFQEIYAYDKEVEGSGISDENSVNSDDRNEIDVPHYKDAEVNEAQGDTSNGHIKNYETQTTLTPKSPKLSIRRRIGLKLLESKEKRRSRNMEMEKQKQAVDGKIVSKKESREKVEKFILSNSKQDLTPRLSKKVKTATVTVALVEALGFDSETEEKNPRVMNCRFKFGTEKFKSKSVKSKDNKFSWLELFNFNMFDDDSLEICLYDNNTPLGRSSMDLSGLDKEKTHKIHVTLDELPQVKIFLLITITGTSLSLADIEEYENIRTERPSSESISISQKDETDVGTLTVIVYGAKGLSSQDCYCVLELNNDRVQTYTEYKTAEPNWMKTFVFAVNDITSILEITIHDERKDEDVGKISIPLLKINNEEKRWYALKDISQRERAKGNNPRVLLEMKVFWNIMRASMRVINPKEVKYLGKQPSLDRHVFSQNLTRIKACVAWIYFAFVVIKTCFEWESRRSNVLALIVWVLFCWFFKLWMLPLLLFIPFVWYLPDKYRVIDLRRQLIRATYKRDTATQTDGAKSESKEEKTSLRRKIQSLQDMVLVVQDALGTLSSFGESVKNLFNFTVPYLSGLAIFLITAISVVLFLIPLNYVIIGWSIHKFLRKILRPNRVPNNEIMDLLSRVPDDEVLLDCEELPLTAEEAFVEK